MPKSTFNAIKGIVECITWSERNQVSCSWRTRHYANCHNRHWKWKVLRKWIFFIRVFSTDTDKSQDSRGREGTIFYPTLPLPPAHENWDIYLQLCMWDDYHVFLIATVVFTWLLLDEIYHLIELPFEWLIDDAMFVCLLDELIRGFCYSDLTLETGAFELASTITLVLQANRLTKRASHPNFFKKLLTPLGNGYFITFKKKQPAGLIYKKLFS